MEAAWVAKDTEIDTTSGSFFHDHLVMKRFVWPIFQSPLIKEEQLIVNSIKMCAFYW